MKSTKSRRTAYVPRLFLRGAAVVAVVPACAAAVVACGGNVAAHAVADSGGDTGIFSVAAVAYPAYESGVPPFDAGVADVSFADSVAIDAYGVADVSFGVAADAFGVADVGYRPDAEAGSGDSATDSTVFGVAAVAYPAYEAGNGEG
jgi:hypothetical protein